MFSNKKKIELTSEELRIMTYSLNDYRNELLKQNKYADVVNEVMCKLKTKMKVDKYELGAIINGLGMKRKNMLEKNEDISIINELIERLLKVHEQ